MSHHEGIYNKNGEEIGYLRKTNDGEVISIWYKTADWQGLYKPEKQQKKLGEEEWSVDVAVLDRCVIRADINGAVVKKSERMRSPLV